MVMIRLMSTGEDLFFLALVALMLAADYDLGRLPCCGHCAFHLGGEHIKMRCELREQSLIRGPRNMLISQFPIDTIKSDASGMSSGMHQSLT